VWGWQIQFVLATVVTCTIFLIVVDRRGLPSARTAWVAGVCLVLLPLCGATGLVFVPFFGLWAACCGATHVQRAGSDAARRRAGLVLLGSAAVAFLLTGLYFVGYVRPTWNPPSPSHAATLKTAAKFLALGFGPAAGQWWPLGVLGAAAALAPAAVVLAVAAARARGDERPRALGLLLFMLGMAALALAVGWGRAAQVPTVGLPSRYVVLAIPALCAVYFVWELYGTPAARNVAQTGLLVAICAVLPLNVESGFQWRDWYVQGMDAVERDIDAGVPRSELAARHRAFLMHWEAGELADGMRMLREAGVGPFRRMREDPEAGAAPDGADATNPSATNAVTPHE
jgi:hypothetical protein